MERYTSGIPQRQITFIIFVRHVAKTTSDPNVLIVYYLQYIMTSYNSDSVNHNAGTQRHYESHKDKSCMKCQNWIGWLYQRETEYYNCVSNNPAVYGEEKAEKARTDLLKHKMMIR